VDCCRFGPGGGQHLLVAPLRLALLLLEHQQLLTLRVGLEILGVPPFDVFSFDPAHVLLMLRHDHADL